LPDFGETSPRRESALDGIAILSEETCILFEQGQYLERMRNSGTPRGFSGAIAFMQIALTYLLSHSIIMISITFMNLDRLDPNSSGSSAAPASAIVLLARHAKIVEPRRSREASTFA
jgi:hypothetical protein